MYLCHRKYSGRKPVHTNLTPSLRIFFPTVFFCYCCSCFVCEKYHILHVTAGTANLILSNGRRDNYHWNAEVPSRRIKVLTAKKIMKKCIDTITYNNKYYRFPSRKNTRPPTGMMVNHGFTAEISIYFDVML